MKIWSSNLLDNLSKLSQEPEKFRWLNGIRTHDLCDNWLNCPASARFISSFDFKHRTSYNIYFNRLQLLKSPGIINTSHARYVGKIQEKGFYCKSKAGGEWFTSFLRVLLTSQVGLFCTGKSLKNAVYCFYKTLIITAS